MTSTLWKGDDSLDPLIILSMPLRSKPLPRRLRRAILHLVRYWPLLAALLLILHLLQCTGNPTQTCFPRPWPNPPSSSSDSELGVGELRGLSRQDPGAPTVNLVVASMRKEDISWTSRVQIPNLAIVRYYTDDPTARYHAPIAKGREALMYHTYLYDFYSDLPDISILIHADETPWHVEEILQGNMTYLLNQLNLSEVERRGYVNLRVSWEGACPAWINTTRVEMDEEKPEEVFMSRAFTENFSPSEGALDLRLYPEVEPFKVPEIIAQPCCAQLAVTRDAVQSVPREEYVRYINWLANTELDDYISGRFWEHSFQYLFTGKAVDCPVEWKAFCSLYGVCFENSEQVREHTSWENERLWLREELGWWRSLFWPRRTRQVRERLREVERAVKESLEWALERGEDEKARGEVGDLYTDVYTETPEGWR